MAAAIKASEMRQAPMSAQEWQVRTDLAACYRLIAHFGLTDTIYTHISARVPGGDDAFLVSAFGLHYEEVTASNLVKVAQDGAVIADKTGLGINPSGFVIHGAIHGARADAHCVLHTHSPAGMAVSAQEAGLLPISMHAATLHHDVAYHDYEGISVHLDERARIVANLGAHNVLIFRNHGLLTIGRTVGDALRLMLSLERACQVQLMAMAGGAPLRLIAPEALAATEATIRGGIGTDRDWASMLRLADRVAPDFRD